MGKRWYNFFVVTDGAGAPTTGPVAALKRVEEVAPEPAAVLPADVAVKGGASIAEVYEAARIVTPAHGYTVFKVAEMLQSEHIRTLPPDVKRKSILVALDAAGVPVDDVVADAVARDRALDTYERVLEQHLEEVRAAKAAENEAIETEMARVMDDLRRRIDANTQEVSREQEELQAWRVRKQREETTIAEAVAPFVSENPITTAAPAAGEGDADVR